MYRVMNLCFRSSLAVGRCRGMGRYHQVRDGWARPLNSWTARLGMGLAIKLSDKAQ